MRPRRTIPLLTIPLLVGSFLSGCWSVGAGRLLADETGDIFDANRQLGRGLNLGNFLESPRNAEWSVSIEDVDLRRIKQAGFDSIRLPVRWSDYAAKQPPFRIEAQFFARVDRLLDSAQSVGLNVVLNMHHYDALDEDPGANRARFLALWTQIADRYQQRPESLYFEMYNEPHAQLSAVWNETLVECLAVIRVANPSRPVIIGPPEWNGIWALSKLKLPDDDHLIVTIHMYNPFEFTHQGASWAEERVRSISNRAWGTADEQKSLAAEMDLAAQWGSEHKRPIYLGEFGAYSSAPLQSRALWTQKVREAAEERKMSWAYWEFAAGFGIFDPDQHQWRQPLLQALIP